MKHIIFEKNSSYKIALLIKESGLIKQNIIDHYLENSSIPRNDIIAFSLDYNSNNKAPASLCRAYLDNLLKGLEKLGVKLLIVADSTYFKILTGVRKVDTSHGYVKNCTIKGYENFKVILSVNHQTLFYNPDAKKLIDLSIQTTEKWITNTYSIIGSNIIHSAKYPKHLEDIKETLNSLHNYPILACDIETTSLSFNGTKISTISFAWDEHNGVAITVANLFERHVLTTNPATITLHVIPFSAIPDIEVFLYEFFKNYKGILIFHNANFDLKIIINTLFMKSNLDQEGLIEGIETFRGKVEDTKIIKYLATNSCTGNDLKLKTSTHEFAGDYGIDVEDITKTPIEELLEYNLKDSLCTFYLYKKYRKQLIQDKQESIYQDIFLPSIFTILQMELTGIPIDMTKVYTLEDELIAEKLLSLTYILNNKKVKEYVKYLRLKAFMTKNKEWKRKQEPLEYFDTIDFLPTSNKQVRELLYTRLKLPILDKTKTKLSAVGNATLSKLKNHTTDPIIINLLDSLINLGNINKILNTFIKAFKENSILKSDGNWYLHGNYNLGGTVSGRMSSCLVGETEVQCSDGTKHLNEITKGTLVPTHTGRLCPVLNVFNNGKKPVYRITTENGKTLTCTSNHRLLTERGFLSLEDLLNENATNIRRRIIAGDADYLNELPQLITITTKDYDKREILSNSKSIPFTGHSRGKQKKKNFCKSTTTTEAFRKKLTKRTRRLRKQYRIKSRRGSQENKNSSYHFKSVHKTETRREKVFKNIFCKKILSKVSFRSKNKGSVSSYQHRKIHRSKRIRFSAHALLDETRKQILLRASSSDVRSIENGCVTKRMGSASYQRRQNRQQIRQSGSYDPTRPYRPPSRELSSIVQIDYVGVRRVYDLEIETDHCYIANGIFVHNSNPNLQNIPSNSIFAKRIKECFGFTLNDEWIMAGADFDSLEDRISALTTKDKNKLKVYTEHYDGHALRAFFYFKDQMPDIAEAIERAESATKFWVDDNGEYHCE